MLGTVLSVLGGILGISGNQNVVTKVGGVISNAAAIPALIYLTTHSNEQINLGTVSLGACAIVVGFLWVLIEVIRRN